MASAKSSLFEVFDRPVAKLANAAGQLCKHPDVQERIGVASAVLRLAGDEIRGALERQLSELDLFDLSASAWARIGELQEYRDKKKYPPGTSTVVSLADHIVKSEHHPEMQLLVNGEKVGTVLTLDLEFSAVFEGVAVTIRDAKICSVATGQCRAEASLRYKTTELWKQATRNVQLPGAVDLPRPIEI